MKRILSLDGGGIKGVFSASFLATLEDEVEYNISDYFDLIIGTSTGGIIALGLGLGFSAKDILQFYTDEGPSVFKAHSFIGRLKQAFFAKYSSDPLRRALEKKFGGMTLGESKTRLVIPSLNSDTGEVFVYKTAHHERFFKDYKEKVVDIALATSAAPTYFPSHISKNGVSNLDGGIWANNPIGAAVVEAIGVLGWKKEELQILSVGCTTEPVNLGMARKIGMGQGYWVLKMAELFMKAQASASMGTAILLTGENQIVRVCPVTGRGRFKLDSIKEISALKGMGYDEARKLFPKIKGRFFDGKVDEFRPFKTSRTNS